MRIFSQKLRCLRKLKSLWNKGLCQEFIDMLRFENENVVVIIMKSIMFDVKKKQLSMQFCTNLLEIVDDSMLQSKHQPTARLGLEFVLFVLISFSKIIREMQNIKEDSICIKDITMQERKQNCHCCFTSLQKIKPQLAFLACNSHDELVEIATNCLHMLRRIETPP